MKKKLRAHFIPNSHLDREWTMNFQKHRQLLVQFLDRLFEIFEKVPEYTFLLDSQTVPLEDYLEIKPEKKDAIQGYVKKGRLNIGPWYTAPDGNTLSGESLARNLLKGRQLAKKFGRVMKVGYTPFGFTQISQLPQIYAGFGIDFIYFYRGITAYESTSAEFIWEGADGTKAICSRFGSRSRYNFFMEVWRPVVFGGGWLDRTYDWTKPGVPFKRANASHKYDHYFLRRPKLEIHEERIEKSWNRLLELELPHYSTHLIPLMQGMDTTMPDELEAKLVKKIREQLEPGEEIVFSTLPKYTRELKRQLKGKELRVFKGEMRRPGAPSPYVTNLEHIASARGRQKRKQAEASSVLQRLAEPFSTLLYILGEDYPKGFLDEAWKQLLLCHPHDTVGGCGVDSLERDAINRLEQVVEISDVLIDEALGKLQARIDTTKTEKDAVIITVFNPSPHPRTETVEAYIDIPYALKMPDFTLSEIGRKKEVSWAFAGRRPIEKVIRNNTDLTMSLEGWEASLKILAQDIPGFGYRTYVLSKAEVMPGSKKRIAKSASSMENEYLRVEVNPDGTIDLTDKQSGKIYKELHYFEDQGECGQGWESRQPSKDTVVSSKGCPVDISLVENTSLSATIRVAYHMKIPTGLIHDNSFHFSQRGEKQVPLEIETFFTLCSGSKRVDCITRLENRAKNHRLRVFFPTGLSNAEYSTAQTPFDVVERIIERGADHPYSQAANPQYPCLGFAGVSDGNCGMAILTRGIHEYEVVDDEKRSIALTLLRSFEVTLCTVSFRWERRPDQVLSQQLGAHELSYAIYPHQHDWDKGGVMSEAEHFILPLQPAQSSPLKKGEADTEKLFPSKAGFFEIKPGDIVLSAIKKAEGSRDVIVRIFNPTKRRIKAEIIFTSQIRKARLVNMNEESIKGGELKPKKNRILLDMEPKKVLSLKVRL